MAVIGEGLTQFRPLALQNLATGERAETVAMGEFPPVKEVQVVGAARVS
jgi:hypothetical protein